MNTRGEASLWMAAALLAVASAWVWRAPVTAIGKPLAHPVTQALVSVDTGRLRHSAQVVISSDPFRLQREPAPLRFEPYRNRDIVAATPVPSTPRPVLVLRGIVGGPPWEALVEGFPGKSGPSVVRPGDRIGDLLIRAVRRDTVIVQGMDSTWRLALSHRWQ